MVVEEMDMADPQLTDGDGCTALHCAISSMQLRIVKFVVEMGADPNPKTAILPLEKALQCNMRPLPLVSLGMDVWHRNKNGETIAHAVISSEIDEDLFYDSEDEVDDDDDSSDDRVENFRLQFMDDLFGHAPSLVHAQDHEGNQPIHLVGGASSETVRALVYKHGATLGALNNHNETCLITAVKMACDYNFSTIETLLTLMKVRGVDIDSQDKNGWTALHWAIFRRKDTVARLLLVFGVDVHKTNNHGRNPLHLVGFPFSAGRCCDSYDDRDISRVVNCLEFPAYKAEKDKSTSQVGLQELIGSGADATKANNNGNLPFFLAAATSRVTDTFLMIRAAASQGLFCSRDGDRDVCKKRKSDNDGGSGMKRLKLHSS